MEFRLDEVRISYGRHFTAALGSAVISSSGITCIMGSNGSGKTTLLKALTGAVPCTKGHIYLDGREISRIRPAELAKKIAVLAQKHKEVPDLLVKELIALGRYPHRTLFKALDQHDRRAISRAVELTDTSSLLERKAGSLSGGELQRVYLAMTLAQEPEVLFLDEPTNHLDIVYQLELIQLIRSLNEEHGIGIIMILHDISYALWLGGDAILLKDGSILSRGKASEVLTAENIYSAYALECTIGEGSKERLAPISYHLASLR